MAKRKSSNIVEVSPDFGPEVITASSEEIMKLKQLHEQLQDSLVNNSKKRKKRHLRPDFNSKSNNIINDDDRPLDASVIESLKVSKDNIDDVKLISKTPSRKSRSAILITYVNPLFIYVWR